VHDVGEEIESISLSVLVSEGKEVGFEAVVVGPGSCACVL